MRKNIQKLPDSELQIMMILWEGHPQMSRSEIEQSLRGGKHLAATTINTLLTRLEARGFIAVERNSRAHYYTPVISKQEYQRRESHSIIDHLFDGSLVSFVAALYDGQKIPQEKKEELEEFLQSLEEES